MSNEHVRGGGGGGTHRRPRSWTHRSFTTGTSRRLARLTADTCTRSIAPRTIGNLLTEELNEKGGGPKGSGSGMGSARKCRPTPKPFLCANQRTRRQVRSEKERTSAVSILVGSSGQRTCYCRRSAGLVQTGSRLTPLPWTNFALSTAMTYQFTPSTSRRGLAKIFNFREVFEVSLASCRRADALPNAMQDVHQIRRV